MNQTIEQLNKNKETLSKLLEKYSKDRQFWGVEIIEATEEVIKAILQLEALLLRDMGE